jgi:hypothetical protein
MRRPNLFAVGVKMKNTTENIVIPRDAPKVTKIDQGDTRKRREAK